MPSAISHIELSPWLIPARGNRKRPPALPMAFPGPAHFLSFPMASANIGGYRFFLIDTNFFQITTKNICLVIHNFC